MLQLPDSPQSVILVIDDMAENRLLLAAQLRSERYQILEADNGADGLALARSARPDLILLDIMLPGIDGFEVCRQLKADPITAGIPVVVITSLRDVAYRIQGIEAGADEFLSRPHHREELTVRVRSLLQLKHARDTLEAERNHLKLLFDVNRATTQHMALDQMLPNIIRYTRDTTGATKGSILLTDTDGHVTHKYLARPFGITIGQSIAATVMREGFAGWIWQQRRGDIIRDVQQDRRWIALPDDQDPSGSAVGVPIDPTERGIAGVIILTHPEPNYFQPAHLLLLETVSGQISAALRNARLFEQMSETQRKLSAILEQSNDALIMTDDTQRIVLFNNMAESLFSVKASDMIGRQVGDVPELASLKDLIDQSQGGTVGRDVVLHENCILYASVSAVRDIGYIAVLQDVTERVAFERREREELQEIFGRYISPSLLEHALSNDSEILSRRKRWAVVLFADLRNNTEMIVNLSADDALDLLNEIFDALIEIVFQYEGTILDLIGDELEVGFNVPFDQPDAARRALQTALAMQRRFDELRPAWYRRSGAHLGLGIGIDQGEVVIGNVGSHRRMNLALVGEAVNTAHRLVDLAEDGQIIVSADYYALVRDEIETHEVDFAAWGPIKIKGIREPQPLFRAQVSRLAKEPLPDEHAS